MPLGIGTIQSQALVGMPFRLLAPPVPLQHLGAKSSNLRRLASGHARAPTLGFYDVFPNGDFAVLTRVTGDSTRSSIVALVHWQQLLKAASTEKTKR